MAERKEINRADRAISIVADALSKEAKKADSILKLAGVDIEGSTAQNMAFLKKMQGKAELRAKSNERRRIEPRLAELRQAAKQTIRAMTGDQKKDHARRLVADFRKIDEMDDEDVIDALEQEELIRLLEKLKRDEE